jgi:hypothetical protein
MPIRVDDADLEKGKGKEQATAKTKCGDPSLRSRMTTSKKCALMMA